MSRTFDKLLNDIRKDVADIIENTGDGPLGLSDQFTMVVLLIAILDKLEDIDSSLGSIYSQLTDIEQALPSKW